jgi:glycosyltransferase involved in cell wall biosynthesis
MKIGLFSRYFHTEYKRGIAIYSYELTRALSEIIHRHDVTLIDYFWGKKGFKHLPQLNNRRFENCIIHFPGRLFEKLNRSVGWPTIKFKNGVFDLLHLLHEYSAPATKGPNIVSTVHGLGPIIFPDLFEKGYRSRWKEDLDRSLIRATKVIAVSHSLEGQLRSYRPEFNHKYCCTQLGISREFLKEPDPYYKKRFLSATKIDFPFLLYVGASDPGKNLIRLLKAFSIFLNKPKIAPPHHLLVIGNRQWGGYAGVKKALDGLGLNGRVHFTGYINHHDLVLYYQNCEIFIFPSLFEGFGLPVLEAMASGAACLISNRPALDEVGADAAEYFEPESPESIAEKLNALLNNQSKLSKMRSAGQKYARKFTWENTALKTIEIYENILGQSLI